MAILGGSAILLAAVAFALRRSDTTPPTGPRDEAAPPPATDPQEPARGSLADPNPRTEAPPQAAPHRHDPEAAVARLFDLGLPKGARTSCDKCDDFRARLAKNFTDKQQRILKRAAQFSDFIESEVWRLSADKPQLLVDLTQVYETAEKLYEQKSLEVFEQREAAAARKAQRGLFDEFDSMPSFEDSATVHHYVVHATVEGKKKYRLVKLLPGDDAAFDTALSQRELARQQMTADFNSTIRRYLR